MKMRLSHVQIIALGFLILIAVGTILLSLPFATRSGEPAPFITALFTSISASCVTGFVLEDTALYWSGFGHAVILLQIQIGGLGVMTIATLFFMLMSRRVGLRQREVMVESLNTTQVGGILRLLKEIAVATAVFELLGAALLATRFIPRYGFGKGLWYGLFHSVSAFCNAGFDLLGIEGAMSSFASYSDDVVVNITMMLLIFMGGIGFLVWDDVARNGWHFRRYKLQSKIALSASGILVFGGALLFWLFERETMMDMPLKEQILVSLFSSVTARNAGFSTIDVSTLSGGGRFLLMVLMFIGGSPGSTAGGVKTVTVVVLVVHTLCVIRHEHCSNVFQRRIDIDAVNKAVAVVMVNLVLILTGMLIICLTQSLPLEEVLFDVISATGTAGMSVGIIRKLRLIPLCVVMVLMFLGRLGSVSFAVAMLEKRARPAIQYPTEKITVG